MPHHKEKAKQEAPGPRYCGRCGCPYSGTEGKCPQCGSPEFGQRPDILTEGWRQRTMSKHGKNGAAVLDPPAAMNGNGADKRPADQDSTTDQRAQHASTQGIVHDQPAGGGDYQILLLDKIALSRTNPRKTFDQVKLEELAASIKVKGVLVPILVRPYEPYRVVKRSECKLIDLLGKPKRGRPNLSAAGSGDEPWLVMNTADDDQDPVVGAWADETDARLDAAKSNELAAKQKGTPAYELVAGERRYRASRLAGKTTIRAIVQPFSDFEVLEIQVIENEQREDVDPLQKADGYAAMIEQHGRSVNDVAAKVGKSVSTIRDLLRLRSLPEVVRPHVASGHVPKSTALLIARVPTAEHREQLALQVLAGQGHFSRPEALHRAAVQALKDDDPPISYRQTKRLVEQEYMVELKQAPFSRKAVDLVPAAGSCEDCPKRAGNAPEEYPGVRADVCTDPGCYRTKCIAHGRQLAGSQGEVIEGKAAEKLFPHGGRMLAHDAPYLDLANQCWEDQKNRSYKTLVGKELEAQTKVAVDPNGQVHLLVPKAEAAKILKEKGVGKKSPTSSASDSNWRRQQTADDRKRRHAREAARRACALVVEQVEKLDVPAQLAPLLRQMVLGVANEVWHEPRKRVLERRDLKNLHVEGLTAVQSLAFIAELIAARKSMDWGASYGQPGDKAFWSILKIDKAKLIQQVTAEKNGAQPGKKKARAAK